MSESNLLLAQKRPRKIYAYTTVGQPGIKVGDTTNDDVNVRIKQGLVSTPNKQYKLLWQDKAITDSGILFRDYQVHNALENRGITRIAGEWFDTDIDTIKSAFLEVKTGVKYEKGRNLSYSMRPEQERAVKQTSEYIKSNPDSKKFLWNAKMRFGKTFASYQLAKEMGWTRILVLTYKPAVEQAWEDDLTSHVDFDGWQFIKGKQGWNNIDDSRPVVWFASYQDIKGRNDTIKDRHNKLYDETWDCIFVDEYHFGAWRDSAKELSDDDGPSNHDSDTLKQISAKFHLYLSGTPFRALSDGEFSEDQVFNWTYADEQLAKNEWESDNNPYEELPQIVMMTYKLPDSIRLAAVNSQTNEFSLNKFFSAKKNNNGEYVFELENKVQLWLDLLRGYTKNINEFNQEKPPFLFEDANLRSNLNHTLWFLPNVSSCKAMERLLRLDNFYNKYKIVRAAGNGAGVGLNALKPVEDAMGDPFETMTITLSCGKLTTGVTVKPWSGVFFLRDVSSPETYFQTGFRAQSPWSLTDDMGNKEIIKERCYIIDFSPNRALSLVSQYSSKLNTNNNVKLEEKVREFINFLPVLCYDGYSLQRLNAADLLDITTFGAASSMMAHRWQSSKMLNLSNQALIKLKNNKELLETIDNIEYFRKLNVKDNINKIISSDESLKKPSSEKDGPSESASPTNDKDSKKFKKELREKLLKLISRIPVFMYITDCRERDLIDVIKNVEPVLFTKVTGLSVNDFDMICKSDILDRDHINSTIIQFHVLERNSINYLNLKSFKSSNMVGGFDKVVSIDEAVRTA